MNPYHTLGVPPDADDQAIRRAYVEAVKQATPETDPERFKVLTAAYDRIKDEASRINYELFDTEASAESPVEAFLLCARTSPRPQPMPMETLKAYLRLCSKT
jgi:DnaJ-class molecular chaperone